MSQMDVAPETPDKSESKEAAQRLQKVWLRRIKAEEKAHDPFRSRARKIQKIYNNGEQGDQYDDLYVPLWWSVVQIEHSGVYSSQPVPDVRPANDEDNEVFRQASDVLERGIAHFVDDQSFDENMHRAVDDYLSVGLGVPRVKLYSRIVEQEIEQDPMPMDIAQQLGPDGIAIVQGEIEGRTEEVIKDQFINWNYVPWARFGWEPCNNWRDCDYIFFRHRMTNLKIKEQFGRAVRASKDDKANSTEWQKETYDIYEIWDKANRKVIYLAKNESEPLQVEDDPLDLVDFYPIPTPMMTNLPSEEIIPKSDYDYIQPYDMELNRLQERRKGLMEQLKVAGAYDSGMPELAEIVELEDGQMVAVKNATQRTKNRGLESAIFMMPLEEKAAVLNKLVEQIQFVKASVDEILGISDIVRGVSNAKEGVGTQELKGRWVGIRLSRKRDMVQYTVREMFRIMGQLLTTHFTPENLKRLTQINISEETIALLQDDMLMDFSIDIETGTTVASDEFRERSTRSEMLQAVGNYAQTVLPAVKSGDMPADVSSAILAASLRPYTQYSRQLDEALNSLPTTQQQLQTQQQQIQQSQQQTQQLQQELEQWKALAETLQLKSTEAKSEKDMADARKKQAETAQIAKEIEDTDLQPLKTASEIDLNRAKTVSELRPQPARGYN